MREFDFRMIISFLGIIIGGGILNIILFRNVFWGTIDGVVLTLGGMFFFGISMLITLFIMQLIFELNFFFKKYENIRTREELYEKERNSKWNKLILIVAPVVGLIFAIIFSLFYNQITFWDALLKMTLYGLFFGLFIQFLIKKRWFSFHYLVKRQPF